MGQVCAICNHPNKLDINRALATTTNVSRIVKMYGVTEYSVRNHREKCLSRQLVKAYEMKEVAESVDILGKIGRILAQTEQIFSRNFDSGKDLTALKALTEQRSTLELLSKISFSLMEAKRLEAEANGEGIIEIQADEQKEAIQQIIRLFTPEEQLVYKNMLRKLDCNDPSINVFDIGAKCVQMFIDGQAYDYYTGVEPFQIPDYNLRPVNNNPGIKRTKTTARE